jgi:hypothetical protein
VDPADDQNLYGGGDPDSLKGTQTEDPMAEEEAGLGLFCDGMMVFFFTCWPRYPPEFIDTYLMHVPVRELRDSGRRTYSCLLPGDQEVIWNSTGFLHVREF